MDADDQQETNINDIVFENQESIFSPQRSQRDKNVDINNEKELELNTPEIMDQSPQQKEKQTPNPFKLSESTRKQSIMKKLYQNQDFNPSDQDEKQANLQVSPNFKRTSNQNQFESAFEQARKRVQKNKLLQNEGDMIQTNKFRPKNKLITPIDIVDYDQHIQNFNQEIEQNIEMEQFNYKLEQMLLKDENNEINQKYQNELKTISQYNSQTSHNIRNESDLKLLQNRSSISIRDSLKIQLKMVQNNEQQFQMLVQAAQQNQKKVIFNISKKNENLSDNHDLKFQYNSQQNIQQSKEFADFLIILKQKILLLQERLKIEIRHKFTLIKQVAQLQKEKNTLQQQQKNAEILFKQNQINDIDSVSQKYWQKSNNQILNDSESNLDRSKNQIDSEIIQNSLMHLEEQNSMIKMQFQANRNQNQFAFAQGFYSNKNQFNGESIADNYDNQYQKTFLQPSLLIENQTNNINLLNRDPPSHSKILDFSEAYYAQRDSQRKILVENQDSSYQQNESKMENDQEMALILKNNFNQTIQEKEEIIRKDNQSMFQDYKVLKNQMENKSILLIQDKQNNTIQLQNQPVHDDDVKSKDEQNDYLNPLNINIQEESLLINDKNADNNQNQILKKNYNYLTKNIDASMRRTKTHNMQLSQNLILTEKSYDMNENQDDSSRKSKYFKKDSSVIFEQEESIILSQSKISKKYKNNNSHNSQNNNSNMNIIDENQRKKMQQQWRQNAIKVRKSQIIRTQSSNFNYQLHKSNFNSGNNKKFRTQKNDVLANDQINILEQQKKLFNIHSQYNQRDRTNSYVLLYQQNNFLTQSLNPINESSNNIKKSQLDKDNFWKEKVQLLIDYKKKQMQVIQELRGKITVLTNKNEIMEKKLKNLNNVINRFDSVQFEFPAPNYYGISPEKAKKQKNGAIDLNKDIKYVVDQQQEIQQDYQYNKSINFKINQRSNFSQDLTRNSNQQQKNINNNKYLNERSQSQKHDMQNQKKIENIEDENVMSIPQSFINGPDQQNTQIQNFDIVPIQCQNIQDENNIFLTVNDQEIFSQSHLINITQTNMTSNQYQQSIPQPQTSQLRMKNKFQNYTNFQNLNNGNDNFNQGAFEEISTPILGRPDGHNSLGEKISSKNNISKQPMNFLKRVDGDRSMINEEIEESKFISHDNGNIQSQQQMRITQKFAIGSQEQNRSGAQYKKFNQKQSLNFMHQEQPAEASGDQRPSADSYLTNTSYLQIQNQNDLAQSEKFKKKNGVKNILKNFFQKTLGGSQQKKEKQNNLNQSQENQSDCKTMVQKKKGNFGSTMQVPSIQKEILQQNINKLQTQDKQQRDSLISARSHSVDESGAKFSNKMNNFYDQFEDYENLINQQENLRLGPQNNNLNSQQISNLNFEKLKQMENKQNQIDDQQAKIYSQTQRDTLEIAESVSSKKKEQKLKIKTQRIGNEKNIKTFNHQQNNYFNIKQESFDHKAFPPLFQQKQEQEFFILNNQDSIQESSKFPNYSNGCIQNVSKGALILDQQRQTFNPNDQINGFQIKKSSGIQLQNINEQSYNFDQIYQQNEKMNLCFDNLKSNVKAEMNEQQSFISAIQRDKDASQIYIQNNNSFLHNNSLFANQSIVGNQFIQGQSQLNNGKDKKNNSAVIINNENFIKGFPSKTEFENLRLHHKEQQDRLKSVQNIQTQNNIEQQSNNKQNIKNQFMRLSTNQNKFQFTQNNKQSQNINDQQ